MQSRVRTFKQTYSQATVSIALHSQLRRHRRRVVAALAVLAVALALVGLHSAVMSAAGDHAMSDAAVSCLAVGGALAIASVAVSVVRRLAQRPLWLIPALLARSVPFIPASTGFSARAGPPPLLQVFRL